MDNGSPSHLGQNPGEHGIMHPEEEVCPETWAPFQNTAQRLSLTNKFNMGSLQKWLMIIYLTLKPNRELDLGITDG